MSNAVTRSYHDEGEFVPGTPAQRFYYGPDLLGSVRRVFASAVSAPAYSFDPYGYPLQGTAPLTDFGYASMTYNPDSGLYLAQHRVYDAAVGRWLSRDPVGESSDPSANLYTYVSGSPLSSVDSQGTEGIVLTYYGYPIYVPFLGVSLPLAHAGTLAINEKTGQARYFEYGRYQSDFGEVREIPNLSKAQIGPNGRITDESLNRIVRSIIPHQKGITPSLDRHPDADYTRMVNMALQRKSNQSRAPYNLDPRRPMNNCITFADEVIDAGKRR